ncbi:heme exporter protein CcmD [Acidomonas methanolica]|nr:heme exporter protein CcmD [Acidomonas methanolica]MCQ9155460.1 heme exporter protein CcmD [Acidomonas methanolica]
MTHLPFIAASYGVTAVAVLVLTVQAALRLRRARTRLAQLEALRKTSPR